MIKKSKIAEEPKIIDNENKIEKVKLGVINIRNVFEGIAKRI
jgi:hypothetical protein